MEKDKDLSRHGKHPGSWQDDEAIHSRQDADNEDYLATNHDVSGNDMTEEHREETRHHQAFGNRHYESHSNHSSADDMPTTDTGA
jgi:hypothetical protein